MRGKNRSHAVPALSRATAILTCRKVRAEPWGKEKNQSPWHLAATVVPDPGGIAAISRWLSASDTTGTSIDL